MSYIAFLKKNLAYIKLGILTKTQYRANLLAGVIALPAIGFGVECAFWLGIFQASSQTTIGGFTAAQYITYLLWLILQLGSANWRFERVMIMEINSGAVNAMLVRPTSFFTYHLGQLLGHKLLTMILMVPVILLIAWGWELPLYLERLAPAILLGFCYLIMIHTLNFAICSMAFFFDHVYSLNTTKNMIIWFLVGELLPLDLLPSPFREWVIALPFSSGVYIPASYISGRISTETFLHGFVSVTIGIIVFGVIGRLIWRRGLRVYSGTGA